MSGRFTNPFPQFFSSTPTAYSAGVLKFYATGTSTPLAVYSDSAASVSLGTSITLNSAGRADNAIFLADVAYKVVLEYPSGTPIWTADPVYGRDSALIAKTLTGSGNPNGTVAGTAGSANVIPTFYWDYLNAVFYVATTTGSASTTVWTALNSSLTTPAVPPPQGYLTPTSGTPSIPADVTSATAVYYTPDKGNLVPIYNGTSMVPTEFSELTLTLAAQHALSTIYDIFVFSNSGVLTLATGPAWSNSATGSGARGTGAGTTQLSRVKGLYVNTVSMTGRNGATTYSIGANLATYLGSIFIDGTAGQVTCHRAWGASRKWGIWNAYNRRPIYLKCGDSTASWVYATATARPSRGQTTNKLTVFCGLAEETVETGFNQVGAVNASSATIGVGWNSVTVISGRSGTISNSAATNTAGDMVSAYFAVPFLGIIDVTALENAPGAANATFAGTEVSMVLSAKWMG